MIKLFISYVYLMSLGQHIGHSIFNTLISNSWYIFTYRNKLTIMNLLKSNIMYKVAFSLFKGAAGRRAPIWFVNLDPHLAGLVIQSARKSGEFYVTDFWVRGLVSNFKSMKKLYFKLMHTNPLGWTRMERGIGKVFNNWSFTRARKAGLVFISNLNHARFAARECLQSFTPSIGIVDSDVFSFEVGVPIPGNDESMLCMAFYHDIAVGQILVAKFRGVSNWYMGTRSKARRSAFLDWIYNYYNIIEDSEEINYRFELPESGEMYFKNQDLFNENMFVHKSIFIRGVGAMVLNNFRLESKVQDIEIFQPEYFSYDLLKIFKSYFGMHRRFIGYYRAYSIAISLQARQLFYWKRRSWFRKFFKNVNLPRKLNTFGWINFRFNKSNFKTPLIRPRRTRKERILFSYRYHLKAIGAYNDFYKSGYLKSLHDTIEQNAMSYYLMIFLVTKYSTMVKLNSHKSRALFPIDSSYNFINYLLSMICATFDISILRKAKMPLVLYNAKTLYYDFIIDIFFKWSYYNEANTLDLFLFEKKIYTRFYFLLSGIIAKNWYYDNLITWLDDYEPYKAFNEIPLVYPMWFHRRVEYYMNLSSDFSDNYLSLYRLSSSYLALDTLTTGYDAQYDFQKQDYIDKLSRYSYYVTVRSYYT